MELFNLGRGVKVKEFNIPEWVIVKAPWLTAVSDGYIKDNLWKPRPEPWGYGEVFMIKSKKEMIFGKTIDTPYCDYRQMKAGDLLIFKSSFLNSSASLVLIGDGDNILYEVIDYSKLELYRKNDYSSLCVIKAIISKPEFNIF